MTRHRRPARVYVASKFENKEGVRYLYDLLRAAGHEITHDWTDETASSDAEFYRCADKDVEGVWNADVLIIDVQPNMRGAWVEFGIALTRFIPIIVVNGKRGDHGGYECIFQHLDNVWHVDTALEAAQLVGKVCPR